MTGAEQPLFPSSLSEAVRTCTSSVRVFGKTEIFMLAQLSVYLTDCQEEIGDIYGHLQETVATTESSFMSITELKTVPNIAAINAALGRDHRYVKERSDG